MIRRLWRVLMGPYLVYFRALAYPAGAWASTRGRNGINYGVTASREQPRGGDRHYNFAR